MIKMRKTKPLTPAEFFALSPEEYWEYYTTERGKMFGESCIKFDVVGAWEDAKMAYEEAKCV